MRRTVLGCLGFSTLVFAPFLLGGAPIGCSSQPQSEHVIRDAQPIQGGTLDTTDTNVVSFLINTSQGLALCSGSLIAPNLVLSAHHCVADPPQNLTCGAGFSATYAATSFMVTNSYDAAANVFNSNNPSWPAADNVTWWSVKSVAVPGNNICGDDMSALLLSSPMSGVCPLIPAVDTKPADNSTYKAVGFGITSPNGTTAGTRYEVSGMTLQCFGSSDCGDNTISATAEWEGGSNNQQGTCEGDSGGPALDATNRIIGTVSRGPQSACNQTVYESTYGQASWIKSQAQAAATAGGYAVAGWVTGGATTSPSNGYPCTSSSSSSGTTSSGTTSSSSGSAGSGCPSPLSCIDGSGMGDYGCFDPSTSDEFPPNAPICTNSTPCAAGFTCWATSASATQGECVQDCTPGSSSSSSSSSTSTSTSSGTSSSSGNASSSGSSGTTTSGGAGGGGTGGSGVGASGGVGLGHTTGNTSGCSVASSGSTPASPASLAGLLLGAALVVSRRRR